MVMLRLLLLVMLPLNQISGASEDATREILSLIETGNKAFDRSDYSQCEKAFFDAANLSSHNKMFGLELQAQFGLLKVYTSQKKYKLAESLCFDQMKKIKTRGGELHRLVEVMVELGIVKTEEGKLIEAESILNKARLLAEKNDIGTSFKSQPLVALAALNVQKNQFSKAAALDERALEMVESNNFDFINRAATVECLAEIYEKLGKKQRLEELFKDTIQNYETNNKNEQLGIARIYGDYGTLLSKSDRLQEAEEYYQKAIAVFDKFNDFGVRSTSCRKNYANLLRSQNRRDEAQQIEEVLIRAAIRQKILQERGGQ